MRLPSRPTAFALALACAGALSLPASDAAAVCDPALALGDPMPVTVGPGPLHTVVGDFNEDGRPDLAITVSHHAGPANGGIAILLGDGSGTYATPNSFIPGGNPYFLAAGDFNGDGITDLAATFWSTSAIGIYLGQGAGGVGNGAFAAPVPYAAGGQPFQIVTGDYDEDGILDLAVAINNLSRVSVLRGGGAGGVGNGTFGTAVGYPIANLGRGIAQGDFNSDGILDLAATTYVAGRVAILLGNGAGGVGNGTFTTSAHYAAGPEPVDLEVLDYDKDGILDLAVANGTSGGTVVLHGLGGGGIGSGTFAIATTIPTGNTSSVMTVDVNEDGLVDLLSGEAVNPVGRRLHLALGQGTGPVGNGTWAAPTPISVPDEPYQIAVADLDADLHPDAIVTGYLSNRMTILTWGCRTGPPPPPDPRRPVLTRVRDVPADEGGRVYVTWLPSSLDVTGGAVTQYRVWREIPEAEARAKAAPDGVRTTIRTESAPGGATLVTFWEAVATLPAQRLAGYAYTAETTEDSTAANPHATAFFVSALTSNIDVSYSSDVVRGASIDNLAPAAPANFRTAAAGGGAVAFAWSRNAEPDLERYRVERSLAADFPPGGVDEFDAGPDTTWSDAAPAGAAYYRVVAIDEHGNAGEPSAAIAAGGTVGVDVAYRLALAGARPNPATPRGATLLFSLAGDAPATLEVFDVRGRRVAAPSLAGFGAGDHALRLDREVALAPGVYVVRLAQAGTTLERKIAIAR